MLTLFSIHTIIILLVVILIIAAVHLRKKWGKYSNIIYKKFLLTNNFNKKYQFYVTGLMKGETV